MKTKIAITGMGIISAIGNNVAENLKSLEAKKHGISRIENIDTKLKDEIFVGEIKRKNQALREELNLSKEDNFSRTSMLSLIAAKEAIKDAELNLDENSSIGFINGTTVGGMDIIEKYYNDFYDKEENRHYIHIQDAGSNTNLIAEHLGINQLVTTINTACSSAANAIIFGARLLQSGRLEKVIVGGADALCKFTINGFNTLMILSDEHNKPFDENRKGLNLGEGAAYLVLETEKSALARNKKPIAFLEGFANANDAYHQTATSAEGKGAFLAMKEALKMAEISPSTVDYINAHGTATENNDITEGRALQRLFQDKIPEFSSTKPFTGHTLAAAASVEAVFSILALQEQKIWPGLNFTKKIKELNLIPQQEVKTQKIEKVLSNSFGFGGNCSSLIFSRSH